MLLNYSRVLTIVFMLPSHPILWFVYITRLHFFSAHLHQCFCKSAAFSSYQLTTCSPQAEFESRPCSPLPLSSLGFVISQDLFCNTAIHALMLKVFDRMSLLGVLLFAYLVWLMHIFLFMFTCMEERPAISRADFQTRIESRQLDEFHKCQCLHNSSRASAFNSLQFHFDSRLCPKLEQIYTQILNIGVLQFHSQGQAVSQGLSSRTVTFAPLI